MERVPVTLDFARHDETPAIAAMSRDFVERGLGWRYRTREIASFLADPDCVVLVARSGRTVAGFAVMQFGDERAHLVLLAVAPGHRRAGIARRLVEWLVASASTAGMVAVGVELRAGNRAAHRLYGALGFVETHRIAGYYRGHEAAVKMTRFVRDPRTAAARAAGC